jgi:hypothetical protein
VGQRGAAREARDGAARVGLPVGRAQAGEGGHHHHAARVGHAFGERLDLAAAGDGAQAVAQPLHHGAADKHAAFDARIRAAGRAVRCAGGEQAVAAGLEGLARVHEHEAARAVGVLGHAGAEAGLAEQRALLVARHAANADGVAQQIGGDVAEMALDGSTSGSSALGMRSSAAARRPTGWCAR